MATNAAFRLPDFQQRFSLLRGDKTQAEFADFLGLSRPTVGLYESGKRIPDALALKRIVEKCGVSADYLLGITPVESSDLNTRSICDLTGLSEATVKTLISEHSCEKPMKTSFSRAFSDLFLTEAYEGDKILRTESNLLQAAIIRFSNQGKSIGEIAYLSPEQLEEIYISGAADPINQIVKETLRRCVDQLVNELQEMQEEYERCKKKPDGDFDQIAWAQIVLKSDKKQEAGNG